MASHKVHPHSPKKPGRTLGFFVVLVVIVGIGVVVTEYAQAKQNIILDNRLFGFDAAKWLTFLGAWSAILGALVTAKISIANTVKQHTMNTLLQMRLSETYMLRVERLNKRYAKNGGIYWITSEECVNPPAEACIADVSYILNYLEFIASAIREGDLDEVLMRESLRGMVCNNFEIARDLINFRRGAVTAGNAKNEKLYEHLEWLYRRWYIERLRRPLLSRIAD